MAASICNGTILLALSNLTVAEEGSPFRGLIS